MRIALCYSGFLRTWDQCRGNHQQNVYTPECDLFFYTYEKPEGVAPIVWNKIHRPFFPDPFAISRYTERKVPENTVYQTLNQWHNNLIGFCLVPDDYDIYVRIRPDIKLNGKLDFSQFDCKGNNIYIPQGLDFGGICDQFAFGSYEVMHKYFSVYVHGFELWEKGHIWHSEGLQLANLNNQGVNIVRYGSPQHDIVR